MEEIYSDTKSIVLSGAEVIEWRADFYNDVLSTQKIKEVLHTLRPLIGDIPLIFTIRTDAEGGNITIQDTKYAEILRFAASTGDADLIDVELFRNEISVEELVKDIHTQGALVIMSNHDFHKTPEKTEIISRLRKMQDLGADFPKIAVMPNSSEDVLTLLSATDEMARVYGEKPLVTMAMGGLGSISRVSGEIFGSALTFGNAGKCSAPGQMPVSELKHCLNTLHTALDQS